MRLDWATAFVAVIAACTPPAEFDGSDDAGTTLADLPTLERPDRSRHEPAIRGRFEIVRGAVGDASGRNAVPVLGDCNGDKLIDVLNPATGELFAQGPGRAFTRVRENLWAFGATMVDLNGDGARDLVDREGGRLRIRTGRGDCSFGDAAYGPSIAESGSQINVQDVDGDGRLDLVASAWQAERPFEVLLSRGAGWVNVTPQPTPQEPAPSYLGFGTFLFDLDGDGARDLFALVDSGCAWFSWAIPTGWMREERLLPLYAINNPMSASPLDADRDGRMDLFVASTMLAGGGVFLQANGTRAATNVGEVAGTQRPVRYFQWSSYAADVNLDGWFDLLVLYTDGPPGALDRVPTRPALYVNRGDGTFIDRSDLIPVEVLAEGMVCGDLASDGRVGCLIADEQPGAGPVLIWSQIEPDGNWIGLRGAEGARVTVEGESPPQVVELGRQSATRAMHADGVLVPIGQRTSATLRVERVGGRVEVLRDLPAGQYHDLN